MSSASASINLQALKDAIVSGGDLELLLSGEEITTSITDSTVLKINDTEYKLDDKTNFTEKNLPLRIIYHCWLNRETSAADYLKDCKEKSLQSVSFLIRTDLINWLSGVNKASKYIAQETKESAGALIPAVSETKLDEHDNKKSAEEKADEITTAYDSNGDEITDFNSHIGKNERMLGNHNSLLRGSKLVDFNYLVKQSEGLLNSLSKEIAHLQKETNGNGKQKSVGIQKNSQNIHATSGTSNKDPIIIIPSSASSVITMANIKAFLENGQYISSKDLPEEENDILKISKKFDVTKQNDASNTVVGKNIRFNIVNNTRMFVKPEYWDRVVAVVVNGQEWQFDDYKWSNPEELFKHCNGVFFGISGETLPKNIDKWNVGKYFLDKNKTYRNLETYNLFWDNVKRECVKKGFLKE